MEKNSETQNKIVETYAEDVAKVIEDDKTGLIAINPPTIAQIKSPGAKTIDNIVIKSPPKITGFKNGSFIGFLYNADKDNDI